MTTLNQTANKISRQKERQKKKQHGMKIEKIAFKIYKWKREKKESNPPLYATISQALRCAKKPKNGKKKNQWIRHGERNWLRGPSLKNKGTLFLLFFFKGADWEYKLRKRNKFVITINKRNNTNNIREERKSRVCLLQMSLFPIVRLDGLIFSCWVVLFPCAA